MSEHKLLKRKKIAALIMGIIMLAIVLFSSLYIMVEADHDCVGEHCHICSCIQQCEKILHQISEAVISYTAVFVCAVFLSFSTVFIISKLQFKTLVSSKIRLNN
ncbi:MAG: hypothetical protein K5917_04485 [Clostridiales bacterium]|nr:hypothetical protein [Clostridiales bacterium]